MWQQITYSMIQDEQIIMYISSIHFSKCNLSAVINTYHILTVRSPHRAQNSTHTAHPHCKTLNSNIASTREIYKMRVNNECTPIQQLKHWINDNELQKGSSLARLIILFKIKMGLKSTFYFLNLLSFS